MTASDLTTAAGYVLYTTNDGAKPGTRWAHVSPELGDADLVRLAGWRAVVDHARHAKVGARCITSDGNAQAIRYAHVSVRRISTVSKQTVLEH